MTTCIYQGLQYANPIKTASHIENISINRVINKVCERYNISTVDLSSKSRKDNLVEARRMVVNILREASDITLSSIGKILNRDHTTIIWAVESHQNLISYDKKYKIKYNRMVDELFNKG